MTLTGQLAPEPGDSSFCDWTSGRVLVAGIGNVFCTDDGFGSQVARALTEKPLPPGVVVTDYGIRGMHLAFDLLDDWDRLILVDLLPSRGRPGTVHVIEIDPASIDGRAADPHGMAPHAVLAAVVSMGGQVPPTVLIGCEGADVSEGLGLSPLVAAAVDPAVSAARKLLSGHPFDGDGKAPELLPVPNRVVAVRSAGGA